jgi:tetratricopeptide (TPR) repeat protein
MNRSQVRIIYANIEDPPPLPGASEIRGPWWAWAGLLCFICAVGFAPAIGGSFLPQDDANVTENLFLPAWGSIRGIWRFFYNLPQVSPLGYSLFMVEYHLWGSSAHHAALGYHVVNLLLHCANAILLWTLLQKLDLPGAFVAAAIFAAHPVQVQSVAWISQQPMLLGVMLALSALLVQLRIVGLNPEGYESRVFRLPKSGIALHLLAACLFFLAILAKPVVAVLPLVVLAMIWWERGRITKVDLIAVAPLLLISVATLLAAIVIWRHQAVSGAIEPTILRRVQLAGPAIWFYLYALLRPISGPFAYARWDASAWWNGASLTLIVIGSSAMFIARHRIGRAAFAMSVMFVVLLLPQILFLDVDQLRDAYVADNVVYAAAAAVIAPIVVTLTRWLTRAADNTSRATAQILAAAMIGVAMVSSFRGSRAYTSAAALLADTVERSPNSAYALNQLGQYELAANHAAVAQDYFRRALAIDPTRAQTHLNLGAYYESIGDSDRALGEYLTILRRDLFDISARCGVARMLAAKGDATTAIDQYQKVLAARPDYEPVLNDLAALYVDIGDYDQAHALYQRAIQSDPRQTRAHINLASLYLRVGKFQEAHNELATALHMNPRDFAAHTNAGVMYGKISELAPDLEQKKLFLDRSELHFREAVFLSPDSAVAAHNLGIVLARQAKDSGRAGKIKEAIYYFNRACQLDPENVEFKQHRDAAIAQAGQNP